MSLIPKLEKIVVPVGNCALEYRNGQLTRPLSPGTHLRRRHATYSWVDLREQVIAVATQEILTADTVSVRITMALRVNVVDAVAFVERSRDPWSAIYLAAQVALREVCASITVEDLLRRGGVVDVEAILGATRAIADGVGVAVHEVFVKDIIAPAEIRSAATELVVAKARGLAKLETARAETAALRSLANAGRLLDAHPALAQLRLVQEAPYGTKVVLSVGDSAAASTEPAAED
ncbi:slipin family protein [Gordonia sp. NPDC003504]